ncbi:hypothetical protein [Nitrosopumilus piranensis]|uniref:Uncharacterized protein n=1 Tax=Nitrosopumilus piranensis TaxID=1582439 RepID=A0A0C5BXK0_9ARCH|nr:hypothetical protein [Nitrosopumilus piranensis]AJM93004.1 hypothetical protein NPIRD3C_1794 [Nitrosopumilus piranensis]
MMISSNLERNQAILHLCQDILASDERIFFVSSLSKNGKSTELQFRNDRIITKMSKQEVEMFFMQRSLQTSLSKEFDDLIGPLNYICVQRETLLEFIFPYAEGQILVLCDLDVVPNYVAKKISFLLRDFDWRLKETLFA